MMCLDPERPQLVTVVAIFQNGPHSPWFLIFTLWCRLLSQADLWDKQCKDESVGLPRLGSFSFILFEHFLWGNLVSIS